MIASACATAATPPSCSRMPLIAAAPRRSPAGIAAAVALIVILVLIRIVLLMHGATLETTLCALSARGRPAEEPLGRVRRSNSISMAPEGPSQRPAAALRSPRTALQTRLPMSAAPRAPRRDRSEGCRCGPPCRTNFHGCAWRGIAVIWLETQEKTHPYSESPRGLLRSQQATSVAYSHPSRPRVAWPTQI